MSRKLEDIRNALEEHLLAINENTSEIQVLFDYLQEMERKMERLAQRLDQVQLAQVQQALIPQKPQVTSLEQSERKVFLVLYTEELPLSYYEIGMKVNLPLSIVQEAVSALGRKGIPLVRSFVNEQVFLKMESKFKERQAKENLVNVSLQSYMV